VCASAAQYLCRAMHDLVAIDANGWAKEREESMEKSAHIMYYIDFSMFCDSFNKKIGMKC